MADLSNELDLNVPAAPSLTLAAAPAAPAAPSRPRRGSVLLSGLLYLAFSPDFAATSHHT